MEHRIVVIADDALPTIHDWALVETSREVIFAVKQSAMTADNLADGWAAYRMTNRLHTPHQREASTSHAVAPLQLVQRSP